MKGGYGSGGSGAKIDRKVVEKNRRIHMKSLCFKLSSLIPKDHNFPKDALSQYDHLDQAADYIKTLRERIESLKQRKKCAMGKEKYKEVGGEMSNEFGLPLIEVRHQDSILEVILITGLKKRFMFYEVIGVLEEEGAEVVNASFSVVGDKIFYTIHSQAISSRIGLEASRVSERLNELIQQ
ncbi:uncharacterized protein A4U43_C01F27870 [Asparagus officinalis]|uniref:BHLH domain-containing protein n=1 Tax=Asparagus officinalis TaxID=4686 RepID=A0A5P1FVW7_ASPOF|nr:uncharacterized protein LOC109828999 [Asparagus officinalis]ONK81329.1 uncharacterized protein A4U43_C01F27870 [Asparagus officinalis]